MTVYLQVLSGNAVITETLLQRTLEIGRQFPHEPMGAASDRLIIAEAHQTTVPRKWFVLENLADGSVRVHNTHRAHAVFVEDLGGPIPPGQYRDVLVQPATTIRLHDGLRLRISDHSWREHEQASAIDDEDIVSGIRSLVPSSFLQDGSDDGRKSYDLKPQITMRPFAEGRGVEGATVLALVRKALSVVEAAAGSDGFLEAAVRAAVEIVGLDRATILIPSSPQTATLNRPESLSPTLSISLLQGTSAWSRETSSAELARSQGTDFPWAVRVEYQAEHARDCNAPHVSRSVMRRVVSLAKTQIYESNLDSMSQSLESVSSVVAAPILDRDKSVAAVLYGDRWMPVEIGDARISELEALLLEVLAGAVAAGIARQEEERSRANLSEFFSPRVASALVERPELLTGRDAEVSVLFCDVRGFSAISESYGAARTIEWINDILTELSQCVVDSDGVLVDYVGDELLAMWGAPESQPDHAARAIDASRRMLDAIAHLRERWDSQLGATLDVGIGINSGPARVGNVGSRLKFKYGVLGHTVNLGSRLQGATKHLGVRCIASAATIQAAGNRQCARRLAKLRVAGIRETVEVYECVARLCEDWSRLRDEYEAALVDYEGGRPGETVHRLGRLLQEFPHDRPSAFLLSRAAKSLTQPGSVADTVWELESK